MYQSICSLMYKLVWKGSLSYITIPIWKWQIKMRLSNIIKYTLSQMEAVFYKAYFLAQNEKNEK